MIFLSTRINNIIISEPPALRGLIRGAHALSCPQKWALPLPVGRRGQHTSAGVKHRNGDNNNNHFVNHDDNE